MKFARTRRGSLALELLERRMLLHGQAILTDGVLRFDGDANANTMQVTLNEATQMIDVRLDGDPAESFAVAQVQRLEVSGLDGNDNISIDDDLTIPASVNGGLGNDTIASGGGNDTIRGAEGNDFINAGLGDDSVLGGEGNDTIKGRGGADEIDGGNGDDSLAGTTGNDTLDGEAGSDFVVGRGDSDVCRGGAGDDVVNGDFQFGTIRFAPSPDAILGGDGNDVLVSDGGTDTLTGGAGVDLFSATTGNMRVDFTAGTDVDAAATVVPTDNPDPNTNHTGTNLLGERTDLRVNAPPVAERDHVTGPVDYSAFSNPPTYGPHHAHASVSANHVNPSTAPVQPTGISAVPLEDEDYVHNLEHGHVWISYDPGRISETDLARLRSVVEAYGAGNGVVMSPRQANDSAVALASWARLQTLATLDIDAVRNFIATNRGNAPERFITP